VTLLTALSFGCAAWAFARAARCFGGIAVAAGILVIIYGRIFFGRKLKKNKLLVNTFRQILENIFVAAALLAFRGVIIVRLPYVWQRQQGNMPSSPLTDGM